MDALATPSAPPARQRSRRWIGWLAGVALLAFLLWRIPFEELRLAVRRGPWITLLLATAAQSSVTFLTDSAATWMGLRAVGLRRSLREILWVRGATHLVGLLNYTLGQGAVAYHLARTGESAQRAAGGALALVAVSFVSLALLVLAGLAVHSPFPAETRSFLVASAALGVAGSAALALWPPAWLRRREAARVILDTPLRDHAKAVAARMLHFLIFSLTYWGVLRAWGLDIPALPAVVIVILLSFVAALPITPYGLGTLQVAQVFLLSGYVAAPTAGEREVSVLAFSLVHYAGALVAQGLIGYVCFLGWRRRYP